VKEFREAVNYAKSEQQKKDTVIQCEIIPCSGDSFKFQPTRSTCFPYSYRQYISPKSKFITNLKGNVNELTNVPNVYFGGGWMDSKQRISACDTFMIDTISSSQGFRSVCEWKKWMR
jgi:hypothetical protein